MRSRLSRSPSPCPTSQPTVLPLLARHLEQGGHQTSSCGFENDAPSALALDHERPVRVDAVLARQRGAAVHVDDLDVEPRAVRSRLPQHVLDHQVAGILAAQEGERRARRPAGRRGPPAPGRTACSGACGVRSRRQREAIEQQPRRAAKMPNSAGTASAIRQRCERAVNDSPATAVPRAPAASPTRRRPVAKRK